MRIRAHGHRFAVLRPASDDALLLLLDNGRTAALPAANCEAPTDNQTYAEFKYITCILWMCSDINDSSNKVASVRTCLSQSPRPPFQGGDQGLRAFHRRTATLPADSGPASDDALFGTRGRRLQSRRAWSSRGLLVAGHDHF